MTEPWMIAIFTQSVILLGALWMASLKVTRNAGVIEARVVAGITAHALEDETEFGLVRRDIYNSVHDFGETMSAVRQKLSDVELYAANTYVRRDGFYKAIEQVTESITDLRNEIRADLQRMEQKIDARA